MPMASVFSSCFHQNICDHPLSGLAILSWPQLRIGLRLCHMPFHCLNLQFVCQSHSCLVEEKYGTRNESGRQLLRGAKYSFHFHKASEDIFFTKHDPINGHRRDFPIEDSLQSRLVGTGNLRPYGSLPFSDTLANPAATRLPSAMSRSALSSLPKGSGRMELVEVKLSDQRSELPGKEV